MALSKIDKNETCIVPIDEFLEHVLGVWCMMADGQRDLLLLLFQKHDMDGDGVLSLEEFSAIIEEVSVQHAAALTLSGRRTRLHLPRSGAFVLVLPAGPLQWRCVFSFSSCSPVLTAAASADRPGGVAEHDHRALQGLPDHGANLTYCSSSWAGWSSDVQ